MRRIKRELAAIEARKEAVWGMASAYLDAKDAHGIMDMGAELQALDRVAQALRALLAA
jgi:hypothetical protein